MEFFIILVFAFHQGIFFHSPFIMTKNKKFLLLFILSSEWNVFAFQINGKRKAENQPQNIFNAMNFNFWVVVWLEFISMTCAFSFPKVKGEEKASFAEGVNIFRISWACEFHQFRLSMNLNPTWCKRRLDVTRSLSIAHHILHSISFFVVLFICSLYTFSWWRISFLASYTYRSSHIIQSKVEIFVSHSFIDSSFSWRPLTTLKYIYIHIYMCTSVNVPFFLFLFWNSRMKLSLKLNFNHIGFQFNYKI